MAERQMRQIIAYLRKYLESEKPNAWVQLIGPLQFAYNSSRHSTTKYSPFELAYARAPNLPSDLLDTPLRPLYMEDNMSHRLRIFKTIVADALRNQQTALDKNKLLYDARHSKPVSYTHLTLPTTPYV